MFNLKLDKQGRVQIPAVLRSAIAVDSGDELVSWLEGERLVIESRATFIKRLRSRYRGGSGHEVDDFLRERRQDARLEEA